MKIGKNSKKMLSLTIASAGMAAVLTGCGGGGEETDSEAAGSGESNSDESIVIEHAFGETVLEEAPERVATIQWGNQDTVLALDEVPVGFSAANFGPVNENGVLPWTQEKMDELEVEDPNVFQDTDGLDFEAISDSNPDVILAGYSGITQEDYDLLSEIAPVVAYPETPWTTSWRDQITLNTKGMGMEEEGEQLIADTEALIEEKTAEYEDIEGKTVAWVNFSANDLSEMHFYTPADPRVSFLNELGLENPEGLDDVIEDESAFSMTLSAENADVLDDVDIIMGYGDEALYEAVKEDPQLGQIDAIENGNVAFVDAESVVGASGTPTALSISYTIDDYLQLIDDTLNESNE